MILNPFPAVYNIIFIYLAEPSDKSPPLHIFHDMAESALEIMVVCVYLPLSSKSSAALLSGIVRSAIIASLFSARFAIVKQPLEYVFDRCFL